MEKRDIKELFNEVVKEFEAIGISVNTNIIKDIKLNNRLSRVTGVCSHRGDNFIIDISTKIYKTQPEQEIKGVIVHEIIHTFDKCFNHGNEFMFFLKQMSNKYGYKLARTRKIVDDVAYAKESKYIIACKKCGAVIGKDKMQDCVRHPESYSCRHCGGDFERIK